MVLSNAKTDGMKYEVAGSKNIKDTKQIAVKAASSLSTGSLVWLLVKRHKVGILAFGNIVLVLNWAFPAWTSVIGSFVHP